MTATKPPKRARATYPEWVATLPGWVTEVLDANDERWFTRHYGRRLPRPDAQE